MQDNILQKITQKPVGYEEIGKDIMILEFPFVNSIIVGNPYINNKEWVLIGAGMAHTAKDIIQTAEVRFGAGTKPKSIILTHGHFDHVGAIMELLDKWNIPVYAHELELPFLTGKTDYPPADPTVSDGLIAKISPTFPNKGINLGNHIQALPSDGTVPGMPGWRWLHTPGHSPGHISLYRESDGVLIAGDAFTTLNQNSAESVLTRKKEINGPPAYFTMDWKAAEESVKTLKQLSLQTAISNHGLPMKGDELRKQLTNLADNFNNIYMPQNSKYVQ